ncbi:hypothetical protein R6Q59_016276 [Mikania micrantha]
MLGSHWGRARGEGAALQLEDERHGLPNDFCYYGRMTLRLEDEERPNGSATGSRENQIQLQIYAFVGAVVGGGEGAKKYPVADRCLHAAVAGGGEEIGVLARRSLKKSGTV